MSAGPDRVDHVLAAAFAKDPEDEAFLARMNAALAPVEEAAWRDVGEPWPTIHVIGAPRSGTTLVTQLLASHLRVAPITNLAAAFWAAPVHGLRLSKKLLGLGLPSSYASTYGRTADLSEPHEFGYFWSRLLGYRELIEPEHPEADPVDWARARTVLTNMTAAVAAPVLFKSFQLGFYAAEVRRVLPRTVFVLVRRDPVENALSILKLRREYSGGLEHVTGVRARACEAYAAAPPEVQAASQAVHTHAAFQRALARAGGPGLLEVDYEALCAQPEAFLGQVEGALGEVGCTVPRLDRPLPRLDVRPASEGRPGERAAVVAAVASLAP